MYRLVAFLTLVALFAHAQAMQTQLVCAGDAELLPLKLVYEKESDDKRSSEEGEEDAEEAEPDCD